MSIVDTMPLLSTILNKKTGAGSLIKAGQKKCLFFLTVILKLSLL